MAKYDDGQFAARSMIVVVPNLTGISVAGTAAAATDLLRIPITDAVTVTNMRMRLITGGTAAGPTITVNKSLAGTGALSPIGTFAFGTAANGTVATVTLTSTNFAANDELVISNVAGTVAATPAVVFSIGLNMTFS